MFKKFLIISAVLFVVVLVSGCNKKETQVPKQEEKQPIVQEKPSQEIEKQIEIENKQEEIDITNWKTYRDEEAGFEFIYPEDWELEETLSEFVQFGDSPINCKKTPEKCEVKGIVVRSKVKRTENNNIDSVFVKFVTNNLYSQIKDIKNEVSSKWREGTFNGCYITAKKQLQTNNHLFIGAFYYSTDLNDEETTKKEISTCNNNKFFSEYIKLIFNSIKEI